MFDLLFNFCSDLSCFDIGQYSHDCNVMLPVNCLFLQLLVWRRKD